MDTQVNTDDRFVTLLFLTGEHLKYDVEPLLAGTWTEDWYVPVWRVPRSEMLTSEPAALATELVGVTAGVDWIETRKRQAIRGDAFLRGTERWVYIRTHDADRFKQLGHEVHQLTRLDKGETSIVRLG